MPCNRHLQRCLLALLVAGIPALATAAPIDPHTLFQAMRAASGGDQWSQSGEIDCKGTLQQGGLSGPRRIRADLVAGRYTIKTDVGIQHGTRGFDGHHAWMRDEKGLVQILDGPQASRRAITRAYIARRGWFDPANADHAEMRYFGPVDKRGQTLQRIQITPAGGNTFEAWINADTHLLASIHHPDDTGRTTTIVYTDYRTVDGLRLPFTWHIGNGVAAYDGTFRIHQCQVRPEALDAHFTPPPSTIDDARIIGTKTQTSVPFQSYAGLILVNVSINHAAPMPFILDSGGLNLLTPAAARTLGLDGNGRQSVAGAGSALQSMQVVHVKHYRLGSVQLDQQRFLITRLPLLLTDRGDKPPIAGLIGYELLRRFTTRIDYADHTLTFRPAGQLRDASGPDVVTLTFDGRTPQVRARVDGEAGVFTIDTGASNTLTVFASFAKAHDIRLQGKTGTRHASNVGGTSRSRHGHVARFTIGPYTLADVTAGVSQAESGIFASDVLGGNIGQGIASRFTLTLDYASRRMRLTPNADFDQPFVHDRPSLGLALNRVSHEHFQVIAIKKSSPAESAGLRRGDTVVALDGIAVNEIGLNELKARLGSAARHGLDVTVLRNHRRDTLHIAPAQ
ncbi:MAG TPA: aspartyl protease family protein [Oleiagrimonas sp.]|nr:aspartyl protease family protein [Oleiagrimonas sp.]